ncbi:MAG TPA: protein kinase, partial [Gemmatimonadales bacterium]|nr:protein kinase [Gemmatimonadales bacterium]
MTPHSDPREPTGAATPSTFDPGRGGHAGAARRTDTLPAGTRIAAYEVERVLSTSSFGIVYLGLDRASGRRVALKEYFPDTLAVRGGDGQQVVLRGETQAEAFERGRRAFVEEAGVLGRLDHPSLLRVLAHGQSHGTVYRAMPYYPGTPLQRLREAMGTAPDEATLRALVEGLLEPLALLHAAGCLHREVTPWSILLLPDDRPVLMDWGAARRAIVGDQARALMTLLTPSFAAPEVIAPAGDRPQGPWTDLYALAAVVRYCISGQLPPPAGLRSLPAEESIGRLVA